MGKTIWRLFIVVVIVAALVPSIDVASKTIAPLLFTLIIGSIFLVLELPPTPRVIRLQHITIRIALALILFGIAALLVRAALLEYSAPYEPSRYSTRMLLETARSIFGTTGIATIFLIGGTLCAIAGVQYLRTGKVDFSFKASRGREGGQP